MHSQRKLRRLHSGPPRHGLRAVGLLRATSASQCVRAQIAVTSPFARRSEGSAEAGPRHALALPLWSSRRPTSTNPRRSPSLDIRLKSLDMCVQ